MMRWFGLSANLQSLGGLAIGIGMMVDGSVVMVENILRHLAESNAREESLVNRVRIAAMLERQLLSYPEVKSVFSQIGRAELGGEPEAISNNQIIVNLIPQSEWTTANSRTGLIRLFNEDLKAYPGILLNISQPIALRVDELLSGVKAQIAVKPFGEDLDVLRSKGTQIQQVLTLVRGASDVQMEQISGEAQLVIQAKHAALARYGLNAQDVMDLVADGIGGEAVTQVIDGRRRFDVYLRIAAAYRSSARQIGHLLMANSEGVRVPLTRVANINVIESPPLISHENGLWRVVIQCNVRGRDMGGFVVDAQRAVRQTVSLPPGYFVTWGGEFERGYGRGRGEQAKTRIIQDVLTYVPHLRVEIVCLDARVDEVVVAIQHAAHTGGRGDGKIYVMNIEGAVRISTGETGETAV